VITLSNRRISWYYTRRTFINHRGILSYAEYFLIMRSSTLNEPSATFRTCPWQRNNYYYTDKGTTRTRKDNVNICIDMVTHVGTTMRSIANAGLWDIFETCVGPSVIYDTIAISQCLKYTLTKLWQFKLSWYRHNISE